MRVVLLAHDKFPQRAKTAVGILRYADHEVVAVLDRGNAGRRVHDVLPDVQDAPIVEGVDDVTDPFDAIVVGVSPIGGGFDDSWRPDVRTAMRRGADVVSGLHYFLRDDDEFRDLAEEHGVELRDVRRPADDIGVAQGTADAVDAEVVLTVGTDCSTGKMTTTMELARRARERGVDAAVVPTGQTGIMIEGWGHPVDRVISDFAAGAVEDMVREIGDDHDYLFVEGQGSIIHPAYSGVTCAILHGAMPDRLVLCHRVDREAVRRYEDTRIPPPATCAELYESVAAPVREAPVVAGALGTFPIDGETEARAAVEEYADALGAPAVDPVRFGVDELLDAVL